jgi:uncharacterized membrane protein (DUF106 family)
MKKIIIIWLFFLSTLTGCGLFQNQREAMKEVAQTFIDACASGDENKLNGIVTSDFSLETDNYHMMSNNGFKEIIGTAS